jgi:hypothetical protein
VSEYEPEEEAENFSLILAFDSDDPEFARGFEAGRLWEMVKSNHAPWSQMIHVSNAEMVMRMCEAEEREFRAEDRNDEWVEVYVG